MHIHIPHLFLMACVLLLFMLLCASVSSNWIKIISYNTITVLPSNPAKLTAENGNWSEFNMFFFLVTCSYQLKETTWTFFSRSLISTKIHFIVQSVKMWFGITSQFTIVAFSLIAGVNCKMEFSDRMTVKYAK